MIPRIIKDDIIKHFYKKKAVVLVGPRQTGKTTLIKDIISNYGSDFLILEGDDPGTLQLLDNPNIQQIKQIIGKHNLIFIDEAQRIHDIGIIAKIIIDKFPGVQLILSGSSAFELKQRTQEPLTGRKWSYYLWPVSWEEYEMHTGFVNAAQNLQNRLVFGSYPDVINNEDEQGRILKEITESYLYKDVLMYGNIKKPDEIQKLVQAISYQVCNEVSYRELSEMAGIDPKTVQNYIDILEKAFVLFKLTPYSRNLRNEIKTNRKIYFYDNGIRNAVIGQFLPLSVRNDIGALWENFLISERLKYLNYHNINANKYFWRTTQQQEVDYIEEINGILYAYEFKWNDKKQVRFPKTFTGAYPCETKTINSSNFRQFVAGCSS